jgi:hypothetical protein
MDEWYSDTRASREACLAAWAVDPAHDVHSGVSRRGAAREEAGGVQLLWVHGHSREAKHLGRYGGNISKRLDWPLRITQASEAGLVLRLVLEDLQGQRLELRTCRGNGRQLLNTSVQ